ncbi:MAG: hypothetical protein MR051_02935 [Lentisphaeria bacterium]|nr:hypothetical protein [Lentisphaeria bacterium]
MKHLLLLLIVSALLPVEAAVRRFRSGEILAAELTSSEVPVRDLNPAAFPALPSRRLCAVLSVRLDYGRKISIFDYSLEVQGVAYPCVAINDGSGFVSTERDFSDTGVLQLLFILDARTPLRPGPLTLKCNLPPTTGVYDRGVPFRSLDRSGATPPDRIPASGVMEPTAR